MRERGRTGGDARETEEGWGGGVAGMRALASLHQTSSVRGEVTVAV